MAHLSFVTKVAGIQAQTVDAALDALQGKLVVKVDVGDQGDMDLLLDLSHGLGCFHVRYGATDNLAAHLFQFMDLAYGGGHVPGVRFGHGLYGYVGSTANFDATDGNRLGDSAFVHWGFLSKPHKEGDICVFGRF